MEKSIEPEQTDIECAIAVERVMGEIRWLLEQLKSLDPDAIARMELEMSRLRIRGSVERHCH